MIIVAGRSITQYLEREPATLGRGDSIYIGQGVSTAPATATRPRSSNS